MFVLTISCLTTSNLPWFVDPAFQVPRQCCSLQHLILLLSPDTFTAEHCSCFGPATSFILGLLIVLLPLSPVAYWTPLDLKGLNSWCHVLLSFYTVHEVLMAIILEWFAIPSSSGSHLSEPHLSWVALRGVAHSFIKLHKSLCHDKAVTHEWAHIHSQIGIQRNLRQVHMYRIISCKEH